MATVYLGHDLRNHRDVSIKVLRRELAAVRQSALAAERRDREWLNVTLGDPLLARLRGTPEFQKAKVRFGVGS